MFTDVSIKISKEVYNLLKQIADSRQKSIKEVVETAILIAFKGAENITQDIKEHKQALIQLRYKTKCSICKRELNEGELAYWFKYKYVDGSEQTKIVCLECYLQDTALAKRYLKIRELQKTVRGLEKIANSIADEIKALENEKRIHQLRKEINDLWKQFRETLLNNEIPNLDEFMFKIDETARKLSELEASLKPLIIEAKKKKKLLLEERE